MTTTEERRETNAEYHSDTEWVSHGMIETFLASPREYHAAYVGKTLPRAEPSPEMRLGSAVHVALLEPDRWDEDVVVCPSLASKAGKARRDEAIERGAIYITEDQAARIRPMVEAVTQHPVARLILAMDGIREVPVRAEIGGLRRKCKPDILILPREADTATAHVVDVKTTGEPRPDIWARSAANYGYDRQLAWYCEIVRHVRQCSVGGWWIIVGSGRVPDVYVRRCPADILRDADMQNTEAAAKLLASMETDRWSGDDQDRIVDIEWPAWGRRRG